jgi:hypothetical protein
LRIITVANRRFFYYLTADERVGDLMWEEVNADQKLAEVSPRRKLGKPAADDSDKPFSTNVSFGTDWGAISAALLTAWERTGDLKYRDKLVTSMKTIGAMKHGWFAGGGGYDPETGRFFPDSDKLDVSHLSAVFGGFEMNAELLQLLSVPEYERTWLQYCQLYNASADEQKRALGEPLSKLNLFQAHARLTAYAGLKKKDPQLSARAWNEFFAGKAGLKLLPEPFPVRRLQGPDVLNPIDEASLSTNAVAQWGLTAIQCQSLAGDKIPEQPLK